GCFVLILLIALPIKDAMQVYDPITFPLTGVHIVLDAGHGGPDGGAVHNDTEEKDITLRIVHMLRSFLEEAGAKVSVTREEDEDLANKKTKGYAKRKSEDIRNRLAFIEKENPDFFLSIHLNALSESKWHGAQTFYYPGKEE